MRPEFPFDSDGKYANEAIDLNDEQRRPAVFIEAPGAGADFVGALEGEEA